MDNPKTLAKFAKRDGYTNVEKYKQDVLKAQKTLTLPDGKKITRGVVKAAGGVASKKVAIVFSGRLSGFKENLENIKENLFTGDFEFDVYATFSDEPKVNTPELIKLFKTTFSKQIKKITFSDGVVFTPEGGWENVKGNQAMKAIPKNVARMWFNRTQAFSLVPNKYDFVLSTRIDLVYKNPVNYSKLKTGILYIPTKADYGGYQDKMSYGDYNTMKIYMTLYDKMPMLLKKYKINPETLLKNYLNLEKVKIVRTDLGQVISPKVPQKQKIANYIQ
tara:strand:- start:1648 stop:2475 length:828 start_codon:yes stop_codon:yes gene_type:complete